MRKIQRLVRGAAWIVLIVICTSCMLVAGMKMGYDMGIQDGMTLSQEYLTATDVPSGNPP